MLRGIDVSDWQPDIDWAAVRTGGYSFALIKATQGTRNVQDTFTPYRSAIADAGMGPVGLYHFAQDGDPIDQADHFCDVVGTLGPDEFAVLDIEANEDFFTLPISEWPGFIVEWCERMRLLAVGGRAPVAVYMSESVAKAMPSPVARWPLWVAGYQTAIPQSWEDWQVGPWPAPAIWQHSSTVTVPGVSGGCDANIAPDDLRERLGMVATPVPAVAGLDHLHPTFADRVASACRATGSTVYSGARSTEEQAELWRRWQNRTGNPANPPGTSWHEHGADLLGGQWAVAVDFSEPYPHGQPGLVFPIAGEPWHGQPAEIPESSRVAGAQDRLPLNPQPIKELPMRFTYIAEGEDYVYLTDESFHGRLPFGDFLEAIKGRKAVEDWGKQSSEFHAGVKALADQCGFRGSR